MTLRVLTNSQFNRAVTSVAGPTFARGTILVSSLYCHYKLQEESYAQSRSALMLQSNQ